MSACMQKSVVGMNSGFLKVCRLARKNKLFAKQLHFHHFPLSPFLTAMSWGFNPSQRCPLLW